MESHQQFADWLGFAVTSVAADVAQSRELVHDAVGRLGVTFDELAEHPRVREALTVAIEALQFEDLVTQLLEGVLGKLEAMRQTCMAAAADPGDPRIAVLREMAQALLDRDHVAAQATTPGEIELF